MSVNRSLTIGIKEKAKHVRIIGSATQFQGSTPANITLQAKLYGITAKSYAWYKGAVTTVIGTSQNFVIANNQVATIETYKVVVTAIDGQVYEDTLSISKVQNGTPGEAGRPGKIPVQREWKSGDVYRNNDDVIDYIYHRATNTWWRLKDGYNNVTAGANPSNVYIQLNSLEQLAVNLLLAENANIANFIFKNEKLISQTSTAGQPNLELDGVQGKITSRVAELGRFLLDMEGFSATRTITATGYTEKVSTYLSNDGSLNMYHEATGSGGTTNKYFKFIDRTAGIVQPHTPVLDLKTVRNQIANGIPMTNVCLKLEASSTGSNVGNIALDIVNGNIRVDGHAGVNGDHLLGSKTVTITNGLITRVR